MYEKRRAAPAPGSIPERLGMFRSEVRFYREIAPIVGARVPQCYESYDEPAGTRLVLEDLSHWEAGADPVAAAHTLRALHDRWDGVADQRWPWLRKPDTAGDLVNQLYAETWSRIAGSVPPTVRRLGDRILRPVPTVTGSALIHGDASLRNMRTSPDGTVALLDWEDVGIGAGASDLAWLLISSVAPNEWDATIAAYGDTPDLPAALLGAAQQGLLSLADDRDHAGDWIARLEEAARRTRQHFRQ